MNWAAKRAAQYSAAQEVICSIPFHSCSTDSPSFLRVCRPDFILMSFPRRLLVSVTLRGSPLMTHPFMVSWYLWFLQALPGGCRRSLHSHWYGILTAYPGVGTFWSHGSLARQHHQLTDVSQNQMISASEGILPAASNYHVQTLWLCVVIHRIHDTSRQVSRSWRAAGGAGGAPAGSQASADTVRVCTTAH